MGIFYGGLGVLLLRVSGALSPNGAVIASFVQGGVVYHDRVIDGETMPCLYMFLFLP